MAFAAGSGGLLGRVQRSVRPNVTRRRPSRGHWRAQQKAPSPQSQPAESPEEEQRRIASEFRADMPLINTVVLTGRLGGDPTLRTVGAREIELCTFSLAVTDDWDPDAGPGQERTTSWFPVEVWGATAGRAASVLSKGLRVGITGTLCVNSWTDKNGKAQQSPVITANKFEILQSRSETSGEGGGGKGAYTQYQQKSGTGGSGWQNRGSPRASQSFGEGRSRQPVDDDLPF